MARKPCMFAWDLAALLTSSPPSPISVCELPSDSPLSLLRVHLTSLSPMRLCRALSFVTMMCLLGGAASAQPIVDGLTAGVGVTSYHGDLDWNPDNGPAEFMAAANLTAFVGADRAFGPVTAEAVLSYTRIDVDYPLAEMTLGTLSLDLTAGYTFGAGGPLSVRVFAGVAPLLVSPSYDRVDQAAFDGTVLSFERQDTGVVWGFPIGIVIQDTFRLGARFLMTDRFEGASGPTGAHDVLSFLSVGYRVDLLRP